MMVRNGRRGLARGPAQGEEKLERTAPPKREWFTHGIGAVTAVGGAVSGVAALVAALAGAFGGHNSHPVTATGRTTPVAAPKVTYKRVFDIGDTLVLSVPRSWSVDGDQDVQADVYGNAFPTQAQSTVVGRGMTAASRSAANDEWKVDRAFIGVSTQAATPVRLRASSADGAAKSLRSLVRSENWTKQGCDFIGESRYARNGYTGYYREWSDCGQVGTFFWELFAAPRDRRYIVVLQLQTQAYARLPILDHILRTFAVVSGRVS